MDWVDKPQNYKDLYGILPLLQGSHLHNFPLNTLNLGWIAYHSVEFQLICLDFQFNQLRELAPILSRFCNALFKDQKSADVVRRQLGDLGTKTNQQLQLVFTSKKIADHLRVTEEKPPLINQQSVVYEFTRDLCDANRLFSNYLRPLFRSES